MVIIALIVVLLFVARPMEEVVRAKPRNTLRGLAKRIAQEERAPDVALVLAIIRKESNWNPYALNIEKPEDPGDDSVGLMQVKLSTANSPGCFLPGEWPGPVTKTELFDPERNIRTGVRFLRWLFDFRAHWPGEDGSQITFETIDAYNVGPKGKLRLGRRNQAYKDYVLQERERLINAGEA